MDLAHLRKYVWRWVAIGTIGLLVFVAMGLGWQIYQTDHEDEREESLRTFRKMTDEKKQAP